MGISKLNPYLKKECPEAFKDILYSYFKGKRIAVDSDNILMKLMSRSHKEIVNITNVCAEEPDRKLILERWFEHIKDELVKFLKFGITLIFVFDGAYIDEKSATQIKRRADKQKRIDEAASLKKKILEIDELERTPQMITELRKKMHHLGTIKTEEKDLISEILSGLGFPVLYATGEGEKLCAMLAIEGCVSGVYSRDTDVVAMGCPLTISEEAGWIYNQEKHRTEMALKCTLFKPILGKLKMEYSTFLDLCIMSGCDFNKNIKNISVIKSAKLLLKHKSIDDLPESYNDKKEILNHVRCREIFKREKAEDICQTKLILNINKNADCLQILKENRLEYWLEILDYYKNLPEPDDNFVEKPPSQSSSTIKLKICGKTNSETNTETNSETNSETNTETNKIPEQKASPNRITNNMTLSLNQERLEKYKLKLKIKNNYKLI